MDQCIFCGIVSGKVPCYKIYEDNEFIAILDINPANPGHLILFPKGHIASIMEMSEQTYSKFFLIARALSFKLLEYGAEGINFLYSMGETAGQRTPHMIIHIIPRYKGDKVRLIWEPKKFSDEEFKAQQQRILSLIYKKEQQVKEDERKIYTIEPRTGGYW